MASFAGRHNVPAVAVPDLAGDVHDVTGLHRVASELFETRREDVAADAVRNPAPPRSVSRVANIQQGDSKLAT